jgi:hypothetical protein
VRMHQPVRTGRARGYGGEGEGQGGKDVLVSVRAHGRVRADVLMSARTRAFYPQVTS